LQCHIPSTQHHPTPTCQDVGIHGILRQLRQLEGAQDPIQRGQQLSQALLGPRGRGMVRDRVLQLIGLILVTVDVVDRQVREAIPGTR